MDIFRFHFLDELASLGAHPTLTQSIGTYMPGLTELVLQPQSVNCYTGLKPAQVIYNWIWIWSGFDWI